MAVDPLGSTSQLLAALRGEMTQKTERGGKAKRPTKLAGNKPRHDRQTLRNELAEIARQTDLADETAQRAIRRRMVRAMLIWEFGSDLREHPEWQPMLESITQALEGSPKHLEAFSNVINQLRKQAPA